MLQAAVCTQAKNPLPPPSAGEGYNVSEDEHGDKRVIGLCMCNMRVTQKRGWEGGRFEDLTWQPLGVRFSGAQRWKAPCVGLRLDVSRTECGCTHSVVK